MKHAPVSVTMTATEFKARCLEVLDRLAARELEEVRITKRGKVVSIAKPPQAPTDSFEAMLDALKGTLTIPSGDDPTVPAFDGVMDAELGILHR